MKIELFEDRFFTDEELENTPRRISDYKKELESQRNFNFTTFPNTYDTNEMVALTDIDFTSFCSHHILAFVGKAHVAYVPDEKIAGISKLARTVDKFAARPQIQERLTTQIVDFLEEKLEPKGCAAYLNATHHCMSRRGVSKPEAKMQTSALRGVFADPPEGYDPRTEFERKINE